MMTITVPERAKHDTSVSIRMPTKTKELIDAAASIANMTFSAFITDSARSHAIDVLLDQTVFQLDAEQADAFAAILNNPPPPNEKLRSLMQSRSPWEQ